MVAMISLLTGVLPGAALACACCADPGTRFKDVAELGDWEVAEIARLSPTSPARLYLSACGMDCVGGIADPQTAYDVTMDATESGLTLTLSDRRGPRGELTFAWPDSYTWFGVDTALGGRGDTELYTEMRFRGAVSGTGDFALQSPQQAELVLSGSGNMCITARSFDGWMLSVSDEAAQYRLFGTLSPY